MTSTFKEFYESVNGVVSHTVSQTTEYVINLDNTYKKILFFYFVLTFINFSICIYNDGKEALLVYRNSAKINQALEWKKVRQACFKNAYEHVFNSIMWPITFSLNIMPWFIIYTSSSVEYSSEYIEEQKQPEQKQEQEQPEQEPSPRVVSFQKNKKTSRRDCDWVPESF